MDPFSISVGALQIAAVCAQCTVQIIKWVGDVRTVEARIQGFYDEVLALQATYEGLEESLRSPIMLEAARSSNKTSDGSHLWSQVQVAMQDSTKTVNRIRKVLDELSRHTGPLRSVKKQLHESLTNGELSRLRQRIQFFNATISLPIQMVCVMLQLEQRGMSADHQRTLDARFFSLEKTMRDLIRQLTQPSRSSTMLSGSTLIVGSTDESVDARGKDSYLTFAKKILSSASAAASTRSSFSEASPQFEPSPRVELATSPPPYAQQPPQDRTQEWIPAPAFSNSNLQTVTQPSSDLPPAIPPESPMPRGKSYEVAYKLAHTHLKLGQDKADQDNHESAEKSFRKALDLLAKHDFTGRISFQPAEVILKLAHSCLKQQKYADAISLLTPVAGRDANIFPNGSRGSSTSAPPGTREETLQALAASQMLGEVYRQQGDFEQAKEHALKAFLERTDELGENNEWTLESVRLVIDVYRSMGDDEEAEAYEVFLVPTSPVQKAVTPTLPYRPAANTEDETAVASGSPPPSEVAVNVPIQQGKTARPSLTSRMFGKRKTSQANLPQQPTPDSNRHSFSRSTTLDDTYLSSVYLPSTRNETRHLSSPSETSHSRANSYIDDESTAPSSARLERAPSIRMLEPTFQAVSELCKEGRHSKAVKRGLEFLESYKSPTFIHREDALGKNIEKSGDKGLAGSGAGAPHEYAPIHFFCELKQECVDEVGLLLKYGANPNAIAYKAGYTARNSPDVLSPLHLAIVRGHTAIGMALLASKDLRPDIKDGGGLYPLLAACRYRNYAIVKGLLERAPKSIPRESELPSSWYGNSVLHDAARHCDAKLVEMLLATGLFEVNQQDKFGKTPLIHAVIKADVTNMVERARMTSERKRVVEMLIGAGADKHAIDVKGMTARSYAERERESEGRQELVAILGEARYEMA